MGDSIIGDPIYQWGRYGAAYLIWINVTYGPSFVEHLKLILV
jgi:hypothetical protein